MQAIEKEFSPSPAPVRRNLGKELDRSEQMRRNAVKLRAALAMQSAVEDDPAMSEILKSRINMYQSLAMSRTPAPELKQELMQSLAQARVRAERTAKHVALAKEQHQHALNDAQRITEELRDLKQALRLSMQSVQSSREFDTAVMGMASTLTTLRGTASFTETGKAIVGPPALESLANALQTLATPKTPSADQQQSEVPVTDSGPEEGTPTDAEVAAALGSSSFFSREFF